MEEHAEQAADRFVSSLSRLEMEQLKKLFEGLDVKGVALEPTGDRTLNTTGLERVVNQFTDTCSKIVAKFSGGKGGDIAPGAAAAGAAVAAASVGAPGGPASMSSAAAEEAVNGSGASAPAADGQDAYAGLEAAMKEELAAREAANPLASQASRHMRSSARNPDAESEWR